MKIAGIFIFVMFILIGCDKLSDEEKRERFAKEQRAFIEKRDKNPQYLEPSEVDEGKTFRASRLPKSNYPPEGFLKDVYLKQYGEPVYKEVNGPYEMWRYDYSDDITEFLEIEKGRIKKIIRWVNYDKPNRRIVDISHH